MGISESISLFIIMIVLALIPGASVALVVTRSITNGISNGIAVSLGIVLGDLLFILLAILGLSIVAETMGWLFMTIKYIGAIYLIWLGYILLRSRSKTTFSVSKRKVKGNLIASFLAGFFLTLGDIKAIFFYISMFPIFVNMEILKLTDVVMIMIITIITVGGVKIFYAFSARKIVSMSKGLNLENKAKKTAGGFLVGAGSYLIVKT